MNEIKRLKIIVMGHEKRLAILEGRLSSKEPEPSEPSDKPCEEQSEAQDDKL